MRFLPVLGLISLVGCGSKESAPPPSAPCFVVPADNEIRAKDANKTLEDLAAHIQLSPEDEALRHPKSIDDVRSILRRDAVYLFADAAAYAHSLDSVEGRFSEASLELLLGESQLVASQVLAMQAAWVGGDLRVARASLAMERGGNGSATTDRGRMLAQLIRVVEEGNKIADALGVAAPPHLARGAEVVKRLRTEAPTDVRTNLLVAEIHRLRAEWNEFDTAMQAAEAQAAQAPRPTPALKYLRGMEQMERFRKPDEARKLMKECLKDFPKFVRAQAALVLLAQHPKAALREIARLKEMNQDHYLVMLLEPTLAADQEIMRLEGSDTGAN